MKQYLEKLTKEELQNIVMKDTHSPAKWRVNGTLSNFTPFYETFYIDRTHKLYKEKKERIVIW